MLWLERLFARTSIRANGCWIWEGGKNWRGYGEIWREDRKWATHRASYDHFNGPIPKGLQIEHGCHTRDGSCSGGNTCAHRACINPDHLSVVTSITNTLLGNGPSARNARKTHCIYGHPFDEANTRLVKFGRDCKTCKRRSNREYKQRLIERRRMEILTDGVDAE